MSRIPHRRLLVAMLLLWCAAVVTYTALRVTYGRRPAHVNVRWAASVDDAARAKLEDQYALRPLELRDARTWSYLLTDVSRANIRAIVGDPAVEDTHALHRTKFRPALLTWRPPYLGQHPWIGALLEGLSAAFALTGALALAVWGLSTAGRPVLLQRPLARVEQMLTSPRSVVAPALHALVRLIASRIPEASPEAVAVFRMLFGAACVTLLGSRVNAGWVASANADTASGLQRLVLSAFEAAPTAAEWIRPWIVFWGVLFIAGAWSRLSYVLLTIGAIAWAALYTTRFDNHLVAAPLLAMICLAWSRWSDAWSLDAWWRRRQPREAAATPDVSPQVYGFTMWVPGVVLATSFAAAAVAKLRVGGVAWITNGTVKYHFLSDAYQAPVDWGLRLAQHEWVAVLLSFAAVALETVVIVGVFSGRYRYRAAAGVGGLMLLIGFALFQGVVWPLWWLMLLSFLPWHRLPSITMRERESAVRRPAFVRLPRAQAGVVLAIIAQQIAVSTTNLEYSPLLSTWGMYATTYTGPEDYESKSGLTYVLVARFDSGESRACDLTPYEANQLVEAGVTPSTRKVLAKCFPSPSPIHSVFVEGRRRRIDWARLKPGEEETATVSGPIPVSIH